MIERIKKLLKKSAFVLEFIAFIKCYKTKKQYSQIVCHYSQVNHTKSFEELLVFKGLDNSWRESFKNKKPKILYVGGNEYQDKSGFLQALKKYANVTEFTKKNGDYGQYPTSLENSDILNSNRIKDILKKTDIDILLMQIWADNLDIDIIQQEKNEKRFKVINIGMDDRHTYNKTYNNKPGTKGLIPILDLALTTSPESVDWYMKENVPALFFPEGSSLDFYHFLNIPKKYDVGFVGAKYGIREKIIKRLIKSGIDVKCYGKGWGNDYLPLEETNKFFNQCKIILGVGTIGHCKDFYSLKLRDFDAPLSGSCYVTHANNDLRLLYKENEEIVLCKKINDYVQKIGYLLDNPEELSRIARNGMEKAKAEHTYEKRIEMLFKQLGVI